MPWNRTLLVVVALAPCAAAHAEFTVGELLERRHVFVSATAARSLNAGPNAFGLEATYAFGVFGPRLSAGADLLAGPGSAFDGYLEAGVALGLSVGVGAGYHTTSAGPVRFGHGFSAHLFAGAPIPLNLLFRGLGDLIPAPVIVEPFYRAKLLFDWKAPSAVTHQAGLQLGVAFDAN